ncbi:serine/threonine protein kinase [filamentous cyanobacterium CCT1]|nr:serine/threonine protein kinase [filamentous cyanobacterium CCT1]PSN81591.1 serine/threonine protein kinase [filamentous cyanobacterium CCP4]
MADFLDFSNYGYRIESELGANRTGGRITYLATDLDLNCKVVIKQFQFVRRGASWSEYDSIKQEIQVLRDLRNPGIPRYLNSFQTANGFCIVQEYKAATPLSSTRSFDPEELRVIATKLLEILVYLQNRIPPIIHRDLKPDNVLVDEHLNVFLVDFGFARVGDGEVGVSSVVKGTLGFMPPEQLFNRQLTEASDLYGLGMTLICLLTHTKPDDIGSLVDISYKVKFKHLTPKLNFHWVKWLEKLSEPRLNDRFANAKEALKAMPTSPIHPPEVNLSVASLMVQADRLNQQLSCKVEITNVVPEITLKGTWEVQEHTQDGQTLEQRHNWIAITPAQFEGNQITCHIHVNTSRLMAGMLYNRTLLLHTNAFPTTYAIPLEVRTAELPVHTTRMSLYPLLLQFAWVILVVRLVLWTSIPGITETSLVGAISIGLLVGTIVGLQGAAWTLQGASTTAGSRLTSLAAIGLCVPTLIIAWHFLDSLLGAWEAVLSGLVPGLFGGWMIGLGIGLTAEKLLTYNLPKSETRALVLLSSTLAASLVIGFSTNFNQGFVVLAIVLLILALASMLIHAPLNYVKRVADYRRLEGDRIRP